MPANSQIVEYALLEDRLVAWIISKDGVQTVDLKIDTDISNSNIAELARMDRDRNSPAPSRDSSRRRALPGIDRAAFNFSGPLENACYYPG